MRRLISALSLLALALALGLTAREPVAFQKVASLSDAEPPPFVPGAAVDIAAIMRAIPDRGAEGSADTVYEVLPARGYQRSVVEGLGNCSNLVKGVGWTLIRDGYAFEVVHLMPIETFLRGDGHTVLRTKLVLPEGGERVGLVDVAAAALPRSGERLLDLADLSGDIADFRLDPLRPESEDWTRFWTPEFRSDIAIGRIAGAETARWNRFLEAIYLDVGLPERLDKILYAGIGVVLGVHPAIYVEDLEALRSRHRSEFASLTAALWTFRVAPLLLLGCAVSWLAGLVRAHSLRRSHSRILSSRVL